MMHGFHSSSFWMLFFISLIFAIIRFITGSISATKKGNIFPYPKGPRTLPVIGNALTFFALNKNPDQTLIHFARKYGAFCMLWLGSQPVVIISSPRAAKDLLDKASGWFLTTRKSTRSHVWHREGQSILHDQLKADFASVLGLTDYLSLRRARLLGFSERYTTIYSIGSKRINCTNIRISNPKFWFRSFLPIPMDFWWV